MNKADIDKQAEREAKALHQQGRYRRDKRIRLERGYNAVEFDKLFNRLFRK